MKKLLKIILLTIFVSNSLLAKNIYLQEGINLFENKKYEDAKFQLTKNSTIRIQI